MAKQIITLETNPSEGGLLSVRAAFWLTVPSGTEIPIPSLAASAWKGANADELNALQSGQVIEEVRIFTFPVSYQVDDRHKFLQICYQDRAEAVANAPAKGKYYGEFFDSGSGWSASK